MAVIKTQAIVGTAFDLGDKDLVVHVLTPEHGRLGIVVRGGKNSLKGRAAAMQPLAEVELTATLREGRDLATLGEVAELDPHEGLRRDLNRMALASYLLDLGLATAMPGDDADAGETFALLRAALTHLETAPESPPVTATSHWLLRFLAMHGVEPDIDTALLSGAWRAGANSAQTRQSGQSSQSGESGQSGQSGPFARKPARFVLYVAEGLIVAAPGEPGARIPSSGDEGRDGDGVARHPAAGPRGISLPPPAVRAIYESQRTETERLGDLPAIAPAAAAGLLRALAALAVHHLDVHSKSWRFLETTVLKKE